MKLCGAGLHDLDDPAVVYIVPNSGARQCAPCRCARARAWRAANPEVRRANTRAWRAANPERSRALDRKWRMANLAQHRADVRAWCMANRNRVHANVRNYIVRRRAAIAEDRVPAAAQMMLLALPCAYCGVAATELDHIVPLCPRAGEPAGRHVLENLAPACGPCNRGPGGKFNLPLDVWLPPLRVAAFRRRHTKLLAHVLRLLQEKGA